MVLWDNLRKLWTAPVVVAPPTKIVAAVASAVSTHSDKAARVGKAMENAIHQALKDGVSLGDSTEIRKRMLAARDIAVREDQR